MSREQSIAQSVKCLPHKHSVPSSGAGGLGVLSRGMTFFDLCLMESNQMLTDVRGRETNEKHFPEMRGDMTVAWMVQQAQGIVEGGYFTAHKFS